MRSLVKLVAKLRQENAKLRQDVARLNAELYGNEYDDMLAEHMAEQSDVTSDGDMYHCETCQMTQRYDEYCPCNW
jgi:cell division protein FtsB